VIVVIVAIATVVSISLQSLKSFRKLNIDSGGYLGGGGWRGNNPIDMLMFTGREVACFRLYPHLCQSACNVRTFERIDLGSSLFHICGYIVRIVGSSS